MPPRRSATYKELPAQSPKTIRLPEPLSRYSTRFHMVSYCPEIASIVPIYKPAPKPSKLLLDYLNTPKLPKVLSSTVKPKKPHKLDFLSPKVLRSLKTHRLLDSIP